MEYEKESRQIIGSAMEVLNTLGAGLLEKPYENALAVEFKIRDILFQQQPRYRVNYKGVDVGEYIPDLIAFDIIVVETKVIAQISNQEYGQVLNYFKITKLPLTLILNFKNSKLEWKRVALT